MAFLHVVIERTEEEKPLFLFGDLTKTELKRRFIRPYKLARSVLKENRVVNLSCVTSVHVIETDKPLDVALKHLRVESNERIDSLNRESGGVFIISAGSGWVAEDIVHCGRDVTAQYVTSPPGEGTLASHALAFLHNPWVLRVGGGLLIIVVGGFVVRWLWT
ncbi:hypothetical protein GM160_02060 [Guyparkeria halophila]|uniref:Uncharacterized protein n=1 Tax=Guyparkeria halophila TaxID=47960 RepID=A0A6I6D365_9GAMM|nr:hypothetical protein [Guyparkeria halophila]QGT77771.1 hypothetical protein GM160_02060 [Guyparkeria halophila]